MVLVKPYYNENKVLLFNVVTRVLQNKLTLKMQAPN